MKKPELPKPGFYEHSNHDQSRGDCDQVFELTQVTEEWEGIKGWRCIIRPIFGEPRDPYDLPIDTFNGFVRRGVKRFKEVTDGRRISALKKKRDEMYPATK